MAVVGEPGQKLDTWSLISIGSLLYLIWRTVQGQIDYRLALIGFFIGIIILVLPVRARQVGLAGASGWGPEPPEWRPPWQQLVAILSLFVAAGAGVFASLYVLRLAFQPGQSGTFVGIILSIITVCKIIQAKGTGNALTLREFSGAVVSGFCWTTGLPIVAKFFGIQT